MRAFIREFLKWFLIINTGIMVVVWVNIFQYDSIWTWIIPQIFGASFFTSLVTTIYFSYNPRKPITVPVRILMTVAHYLVLCVVIFVLGVVFDWFNPTPKGLVGIALSVAGVYLIVSVIAYVLSKGEADEMTKALKDYKGE